MARGKGRGKGPNLFIASFYAPGTFVVTIISTPILIKTKLKKRTWQLFLIALKIVLLTERKLQFAFHQSWTSHLQLIIDYLVKEVLLKHLLDLVLNYTRVLGLNFLK